MQTSFFRLECPSDYFSTIYDVAAFERFEAFDIELLIGDIIVALIAFVS